MSTSYDPMLGKVIAHGPRPRVRSPGAGRRARRDRDPRADDERRVPAGAGRERRVPRRDDRHRLARHRRGRAAGRRAAADLRRLGQRDAHRGRRTPATRSSPTASAPARTRRRPSSSSTARSWSTGPAAPSTVSRSGRSPPPTTPSCSRSTATATRAVVNVQPHVAEVSFRGQRFVFERPDVFGDHAVVRRRRDHRADAGHRAGRPGRRRRPGRGRPGAASSWRR